MPRSLVLAALVMGAGGTLVLSTIPWFARVPLAERLRRHQPGAQRARAAERGELVSVAGLRDAVAPLAALLGGRVSRALGVGEDVEVRLRRIGAPVDAATFRLRQLAWAAVLLVVAAGVAAATGAPPPATAALVVCGPALAFLVLEQQLSSRSEAWKERLFLELPVVSEQLGMLLGAGYSLGAALDRIAARGSGTCAAGLAEVRRRVHHGLSEVDALEEWAEIADVEELHRLVGILALNRETGDLGRMIGDEARALRREQQRRLVAAIERRAQAVWIPVTVATLVPGALLVAVPFVDAMRLFTSA